MAEFVTAMAELHHAVNHTLDGELDPAARARILDEVGVVPDDLITFAEVYGGDVSFMLTVWDSVARETRFLATQAPVPELPPGR
jgi:hypothetical protein